MELLERSQSLNIVSAKTSKAAAFMVKVKRIRDGELKDRLDDDPDTDSQPSKAREDALLAKAETLVREALVELKTV